MRVGDDILEDFFEFWTPNEIKAYVASVARGYSTLGAEIATYPNVLTAAQRASWTTLLNNFNKFVNDQSFLSSLSMGTVRTAERFAADLDYYWKAYEAKSNRKVSGALVQIASTSVTTSLDTLKAAAMGIALAAVSVLAFKYFMFRN